MKQYVTYLRVSTQRQGAQGLGISAQRAMCDNFIKQNSGMHVQEFMDVESGTHRDRKGLWDAIDYCKKNNCSLVIAKLDRLARDVEFTFKVLNTGIDIHFTDMPVVNSMILGVFAAVAQYERELTSDRTTKALAAKRERGESTGGASERWRMAYEKKTWEQKHNEGMKKGMTKNLRHLESRDVQVFMKVLRNVFPDACTGDVTEWDWDKINTKADNRAKILGLMRDYKELEPTLFVKWDFDVDDILSRPLLTKLSSYIVALRKSVKASINFKNNE